MRFLIALLMALCLAVPVLASPGEKPEDAAKVAKKVERAAGSAHRADEEREALQHFRQEVAQYADLHDKELAKLGTHVAVNATEAIAAQKALASAIATKRENAKPGDVFRKDVQPLFRRLIADQLMGPDALAARKAVLEGNPEDDEEGSVPVVVRVNAEYPPGAPRSTVPPSVLLTLPTLPECLHYRFVGRDLILVDSVAQLIIDFLPSATPELTTK